MLENIKVKYILSLVKLSKITVVDKVNVNTQAAGAS